MELRYTASRSDVRALLLHNLRHTRRMQLTLLAVAVFPIILGAATLAAEHAFSAQAVVPYLVAGPVAAVLVMLLAILRTKKDERSLHLEPAGIRTTVGTLHGAISWRQIDSVADDGQRIFITGKSMNGFVVPGAAFRSADERAALIASMESWRRTAQSNAPAS